MCRPWTSCTDLNGEDGCVSDDERFDLEGLAEGGGLVHGAHRRCLICVDVLPQLLSAQKQIHSYNHRVVEDCSSSASVVDTYFPTALSSTSWTLGTRVAPPTKITCSISSCWQKYKL